MTISPVPNQINHNVLLELITELNSNPHHSIHKVRIISIDVDDWRFDCLCHFCTVKSRSALHWDRRKPNLVVDNDMHTALDAVAIQILHLQMLIDNTLPSDRSVSMNDNSKSTLSGCLWLTEFLNGASLTTHYWVDCL